MTPGTLCNVMTKNSVIQLRCSPEEKAEWGSIAKAAGVSVSDLIRASIGVEVQRRAPVPMERAMREAVSPDYPDIMPTDIKPKQSRKVAVAAQISTLCDHAGTEFGKLSGVGACPKCGKMVTAKDMGAR